MSTTPTPLGAIARGLGAGLVGTGVMTLAQTLPSRLQSSASGSNGGDSQDHQSKDPWEEASAPAKVAKRVSEGIFHHDLPPERIPLMTHGMHWSYGTGWGAVYGLAQATLHAPTMRHGALFGTLVWAMSYVQLVPMGLYQLPWKYPPKDIAMEVGYHLAYGLGVAGTFRVLDGRS